MNNKRFRSSLGMILKTRAHGADIEHLLRNSKRPRAYRKHEEPGPEPEPKPKTEPKPPMGLFHLLWSRLARLVHRR